MRNEPGDSGVIRVVYGPPCAGKSQHVQESRGEDDPVIDYDRLAQSLGASASHGSTGAIRKVALAARSAAIDRVLEGVDSDAWIIHTAPQTEALQRYADAGAEFVLVDPGKEECLKRADADGRPDTTAGVIEAWYSDPPKIPAPQRSITVRSDPIARRIASLDADRRVLARAEAELDDAAADARELRKAVGQMGSLGEAIAALDETLEATGAAVFSHKARFLEIYAELAKVRAQNRSLADAHRGTYSTGEQYTRGDLLTHSGGMWLAMSDGSDKPGTSEQWRLVVKAGRNASR
ncbi:hypothetical protein BH23GEM6_BH23GEM6_04370 [soil metagenome]